MASKHWRVGVAVALGLLVPATAGWADGAAAVQAVKNLGGHVEVDAQRPGKPVVTVTLHGIQVTDSGLQGLPTTPPSRGSRGAPLSPPRPVPTTKESRIPLTDRVTFLPSARASN